MPDIVLTLVTRRDCHLCDEMKAVVQGFAAGEAIAVEIRDADDDEELRCLYGDEVPVLLVNGRRAFKYRVTTGELRRRVAAEVRRLDPRSRWWRWMR